MDKLSVILQELDISKVKLSKYLGISRQMIYNYLAEGGLNKMPEDKKTILFDLLEINSEKEIDKIKITPEYRIKIEEKLLNKIDSETAKKNELSKNNNELLNNFYNMIKEKLSDDKNNKNFKTITYMYNLLQSIDTSLEIKYVLGYFSKTMGFTDIDEYEFNENNQFLIESIMYTAFNLYSSGKASKSKLLEAHNKWKAELEAKKEELLTRTQKFESTRIQALKELGYSEISEKNASEIFEKMAEIELRVIS